jgi:hypothetical protein
MAVASLLKPNPLHLVLWEPLFGAVVEFGRARAFVRRHFPRVFERAALGKISGRPWRMLAGIDFGLARQSLRPTAAAHRASALASRRRNPFRRQPWPATRFAAAKPPSAYFGSKPCAIFRIGQTRRFALIGSVDGAVADDGHTAHQCWLEATAAVA